MRFGGVHPPKLGVVLMSPFQRSVVALSAAAIFLAAWVFRYEIVPVGRGGDTHIAGGYLLDRWTGDVKLLFGAQFTPVIEREAAP